MEILYLSRLYFYILANQISSDGLKAERNLTSYDIKSFKQYKSIRSPPPPAPLVNAPLHRGESLLWSPLTELLPCGFGKFRSKCSTSENTPMFRVENPLIKCTPVEQKPPSEKAPLESANIFLLLPPPCLFAASNAKPTSIFCHLEAGRYRRRTAGKIYWLLELK